MWFADIFCDPEWVCARNGVLGPKRFALRGARSASLWIGIEFLFFGDDQRIRHVRALMNTEDRQIAETCVNMNVQTWVASLEVAVMLETKRPFRIFLLPGTETFAIALSERTTPSPGFPHIW
jgi:hypothetical protein